MAALAYALVAGYRFGGGQYASLSPWYVQVLLIPGWCLVFLALSRSGLAGRIVRSFAVCLWAYVIVATYWVKLIPFYAGYPEGPVKIGPLLRWYGGLADGAWETLSLTSIMPASLLLPLAVAVAGCAVVLAARLVIAPAVPAPGGSTPRSNEVPS
jgi:hypothetical protein